MIDILTGNEDGLFIENTQAQRGANILNTQLGALEYEQTLGIDLRYFLTEDVRFQNGSFQAYLIQVLATRGINVSNFISVIQDLSSFYDIRLSPEESSSGLVAR